MIRLLFVLTLVLTNLSLSQGISKSIFIETNYVRIDSINANVFISYKIPYDRIVFIKGEDKYEANLTFNVEVKNSERVVKRESSTNREKVENYSITNSVSNFIEGLVSFSLENGEYSIAPGIYLANTNKTYNFPEYKLSISDTQVAGNGFIVEDWYCDSVSVLRLLNFGGAIPFSSNNYSIIIPRSNFEDTTIMMCIYSSKDSLLFNISSSKYFDGEIQIDTCQNAIVLINSNKKNIRNFVFWDFTNKLDEGEYYLSIHSAGDSSRFPIMVEWVDKPFSLIDPKRAIELLKIIETKEVVNSLLKNDDEEYYDELNRFWKKYDNNKATVFNEVMNEFYLRVDYADKNFNSVTIKNGADSDRGKVYVRFGKPDEITRSYSQNNRVTEIWYYFNIKKEFVFTDESGLGNFSLQN